MAELKTKATNYPVANYLLQIPDQTTCEACLTICKIMEEVTQSTAKMWGNAIIGVGDYQYQYANGKSNDWFMMGFSPRKANISLYILGCEGTEKHEILTRLGKHKTGKGCVYIKSLTDINVDVLREMCEISYRNLKK